jgi:hypothetical protein
MWYNDKYISYFLLIKIIIDREKVLDLYDHYNILSLNKIYFI